MNKPKSLNADWLGIRFRLKLEAKIIFPFRLDIPETQEYNLCRAVITVKDISWMKRPIDLKVVQGALVNMSRSKTHPNILYETKAPYFVHHEGQDSDFYFKYNWEKRHHELISITPTQNLYNDNGELAEVYRFGLER